ESDRTLQARFVPEEIGITFHYKLVTIDDDPSLEVGNGIFHSLEYWITSDRPVHEDITIRFKTLREGYYNNVDILETELYENRSMILKKGTTQVAKYVQHYSDYPNGRLSGVEAWMVFSEGINNYGAIEVMIGGVNHKLNSQQH
ncbi:MAG: hypothetical protein ACRCST_05585, partial [Turicibacter sp.]